MTLAATREKSNRYRYVGIELEARLRQAELEIQSGKASSGRAHLEQVQNDARSKGFLLMARKASSALHTYSSSR